MKTSFLLMLLFSMQLCAQAHSKNNFDGVRSYLLEIQKAVNYAPNSKKEKIDKLDQVIRQGKEQRRILQQSLKNAQGYDPDEIIREFNLILQAVILLKTDINKNVPLSLVIDYLNKKIPYLRKKLHP